MAIIETERLTKIFPGRVTAVDAVDFEVREGEIFGFLGPNGAGKTTTIKMLNTLLRPTSGRATVAGFDVVRNPAEVRRVIGYVAQDVGVDEHATGRENLTLYGHFYRLDSKTIRERVKRLFELVDLAGFEDKMVSTYSGGMRKRLDIAMGLIHEPRLIFLDEPTVGLDPQTRARIWDYVRNLARSLGITVFLTTHYMDEADKLADRIAIIDQGRIMTIGTPDALKRSIGGDVVTLSPGTAGETEHQALLERIRSALSGQRFVKEVQSTNGEIAVLVESGEAAAPAIMRLLGGAGIEVERLSVSRPTLDDVFLKYTGRSIRTQEGTRTTYAELARRRNRRGA